MGGLLAGLGQGLAKGIEAGAKVYAEGTLEQIKQDASERREMNLARITNLFADERQASSQKHELGMAETRVTKELGMAKTRATHELEMAETEKGLKLGMAGTRAKHELDMAGTRVTHELGMAKTAKETAKDLAKFKNDLMENESSGTTYKVFKDLVKVYGGDEEKAKEVLENSLSGTKEEKLAFSKSFSSILDMYTTNAKISGIPIDTEKIPELMALAKKQASEITGHYPKATGTGKPPPPGESEFAQAKREKAEKAAEQAKLAAEKAKKGLISGAQVPPSSINVYEQ